MCLNIYQRVYRLSGVVLCHYKSPFLFHCTICSFFFVSLQPSKELIVRDFEFRERMFTSITDLITLAIFLGISPPVKEGMTTYIRGNDKKDITPFRNFLKGKSTTWTVKFVLRLVLSTLCSVKCSTKAKKISSNILHHHFTYLR